MTDVLTELFGEDDQAETAPHVSTKAFVFDIETGPLSGEELDAIRPEFDKPDPGEFDESTVKLGRLKDPEKIAAKIDEARDKHAQAVTAWAKARDGHAAAFAEAAPLSAITGRVLAIGYGNPDGEIIIDGAEERDLLSSFWDYYADVRSSNGSVIGYYSNSFDVPFIVQRSWRLGIKVPRGIIEKGRWLSPVFVDLRDAWLCGSRSTPSHVDTKLDTIAKYFGHSGKTGDGADFHKLWANEETRQEAVEYLRNDVQMTLAVAIAMGLI